MSNAQMRRLLAFRHGAGSGASSDGSSHDTKNHAKRTPTLATACTPTSKSPKLLLLLLWVRTEVSPKNTAVAKGCRTMVVT